MDAFGLHYDTVEHHGWYRNLDPTVEQLARVLRDGDDPDRLLGRHRDPPRAPAPADRRPPGRHRHRRRSPKFLRLALESFGDDQRVAFRLLRYLKHEKRLESSTRCSAPGPAPTRSSRPTRFTSTTTSRTLSSLARVLKPGGRVRVHSGQHPQPARAGERVDHRRDGLRRPRGRERDSSAPTRARRRTATCSTTRSGCARTSTAATASSSRRARSTTTSTRCGRRLRDRGGDASGRSRRTSSEWYEFLAAYPDAVLGWVGGSEKVDGAAALPRRRPPTARPAPRVPRRHLRRPRDVPLLLDVHLGEARIAERAPAVSRRPRRSSSRAIACRLPA